MRRILGISLRVLTRFNSWPLILIILFGAAPLLYTSIIEYQRDKEGVETISKLQENADGYVEVGLYKEAAVAYGELSLKLKREGDQALYCYANYMQGDCYIKLAIEYKEKEGKVNAIKNAIMPIMKLLEETTAKENPYYAKACENLGYAYWLLSEYEDQEENLIKSIASYEKVIKTYDSDKNISNDVIRAKLNKSRVEYILNELHKKILN